MGSSVLRTWTLCRHLLLGIHERLHCVQDRLRILCELGLDFWPAHVGVYPRLAHLLREGSKGAGRSRRQPSAAIQVSFRTLGQLLRTGVLRAHLVDKELQCVQAW